MSEDAQDRCDKDKPRELKVILTVEPESIKAFTADGIWEKIKFSVDSGATESVCPQDMPASVPTVAGDASRRGVEYEVANGVTMPSEGEDFQGHH